MSDPIAHQTPTDDLENSTAITTVNDETMVHAAEQAARLVETKAGKRPKSGRMAKRAMAEDAAAKEALPDPVPLTIETSVDVMAAPILVSEAFAESAAESAERPPRVAETLVDGVAAATVLPDGVEGEGHSTVVETPIERAPDPMAALRGKLAQTFHSNLDDSVAFWVSLIQVRSPSEALELNAAHLRRQMESFAAQSRDFSSLAQQAAAASMTSLARSLERLRS